MTDACWVLSEELGNFCPTVSPSVHDETQSCIQVWCGVCCQVLCCTMSRARSHPHPLRAAAWCDAK